jgi:predicted CoA-binding protein
MTRAVEEPVRTLLTSTRTWAIVGCSPDPSRDSHRVAALLQHSGFTIIPVNPAADRILGERAYPSVAEIPQDIAVDVVDVFRRSDAAGKHVNEAIARRVKGVWLQLGVIDHAAAARARAAGLKVVMDRCPAIELPRLEREGAAG